MDHYATQSRSERDHLVRHIFEQHHEVLYLRALGLCRRYRRDVSYADDLLQDFYYLLLARHEIFKTQYDRIGLAYLYRCLNNSMIDLDRRYNSLQRREGVFRERAPETSNIYYLCTDSHLEAFLEMMEQLLTPRDFAVMKAYIYGYKYKEISEMLGIPENYVGVIVHRAKKIISDHLMDED